MKRMHFTSCPQNAWLYMLLCAAAGCWLLCASCSLGPVAGSGTEEGNVVSGIVIDTSGNKVAEASVTLIPAGYNTDKETPVPFSKTDTTGKLGVYAFTAVGEGAYTIQTVHRFYRTRALITGIAVKTDTTIAPVSVVKNTGAIHIFLPDTIDTVNGYLYIPGTTIYRDMSAASFGAEGLGILIDSVPEAAVPPVYYARKNNPAAPVRFTDTVTVVAKDTAVMDAFIYWTNYTKDNTPFPGTMVYDADATPTTVVFATDRGIAELTPTGFWIVNTGSDIGLTTNSITSVCYQINGQLWAGTSAGAAIQKFNGWQAYTTGNSSIPTNRITDIQTERIASNRTWFGTEERGLLMFDDSAWIQFDTSSSRIGSNRVAAVCIDRGDTVWCATQKGVFKKKDGYSETFGTWNTGIPADDLYCMTIDKNRNKWFGYFGGVVRFNEAGNTWTPYTSLHSVLLADSVLALAGSDKGELWVGTKKGLCMFDGAQWHDCTGSRYKMLANNEVRAIVVDSDGNKWIGTASSGVIAFGPTIQ